MKNTGFKWSQNRAVFAALMSLLFIVYTGEAAAADTIGTVASNIKSSFGNLAQLVTATAWLAGMGFAVAAIIKFKAHKDNPAQVPIGQPIGLLVVAGALLFLPSLLGVTGETIFGAKKVQGTISGVSSFQ